MFSPEAWYHSALRWQGRCIGCGGQTAENHCPPKQRSDFTAYRCPEHAVAATRGSGEGGEASPPSPSPVPSLVQHEMSPLRVVRKQRAQPRRHPLHSLQ